MRVYLAGTMEGNQGHFMVKHKDSVPSNVAILESFFYADEFTEKIIPGLKDILLDSGAFSFMVKGDGKVDWYEYIDKYADFIIRNKIEKFIELDIDPIVGYDEVLKLRAYLEEKVGRPSIPVWHKSRGLDAFKETCEKYPYVAIGGIVTKEFKKTDYKTFPWFINTAHQNGAKIHGLGLTNIEAIHKYKFDSVDSSSWTCGNRFGFIYHFNGHGFDKMNKPVGFRIKDPAKIAIHNFNEWVKFQKYAEKHL